MSINTMQDALTAWGSPLQPVSVSPMEDAVYGLAPKLNLAPYIPPSNNVNEVISKLKNMATSMEVYIAYFNKFKGQSMAINKFGITKFELLKIVDLLEK